MEILIFFGILFFIYIFWGIFSRLGEAIKQMENINETINNNNEKTTEIISMKIDELKEGIKNLEIELDSISGSVERFRKLSGALDDFEKEEESFEIAHGSKAKDTK